MMDNRFTFLISDESVNKYGFRVLTGGIDFQEFSKNPVMFWNHKTDLGDADRLPIGRWENLRTEGDKLLADAVLDMNDELGRTVANKIAGGFLNACSIGIGVIEMSDKAELMADGQTRPTITRSILEEVSIVDIPANSNAMKLRRAEDVLQLSANMDINKLDRIMDKVKLGANLGEQARAAVDAYMVANEVEAEAAEATIAEFIGVTVEELQAVKAGEACATYEQMSALAEVTGAALEPMIEAAIADGCEVVMPEEEMMDDKEEEEDMAAPTVAEQISDAVMSFVNKLKEAFNFVPKDKEADAEQLAADLFAGFNVQLNAIQFDQKPAELADLAHEVASLRAELAGMKEVKAEGEKMSLKKSSTPPAAERAPMTKKEDERSEDPKKAIFRAFGQAGQMFNKRND